MLAKIKSGPIGNFGKREGSRWRWEIDLWHTVFDWEVDILEELKTMIKGLTLAECTNDSTFLTFFFFSINGNYSKFCPTI